MRTRQARNRFVQRIALANFGMIEMESLPKKYIDNIADSENLISISIEASPQKSINRISDYLLKNNYSQN